jgi:predicted ATPase
VKSIDAKHYLLEATILQNKTASLDVFPFTLPAIRNLKTLTLHPSVTFFVGENGSGKSTLLEALAVSMGLNPEGGSRNFRFSTRTSHSELHKSLRINKGVKRARDSYFLRAESFFNVATEIENLDKEPAPAPKIIESYGGHSLHEQSHGESFFALLFKRLGGQGLYFLDEPEAALSPTRQLAMLTRMHELVQKQSQFIIATHSPILMAYPNADIFYFSKDGIQKIDYHDTEHFRVTRDFLNSPERSLKELLQ